VTTFYTYLQLGAAAIQVFRGITEVAADPAQANIKIVRRAIGFFDTGAVDKIFTSGSILSLNIFPNITLSAEVTHINQANQETKIASGSIENLGSFVFTKVSAAISGYAESPQGIFEIRGDGDSVVISELSRQPILRCGVENPGAATPREIQQCLQDPPSGADIVNVLVVYTPSVASENSADYLSAPQPSPHIG
jgi:hypothetical protein